MKPSEFLRTTLRVFALYLAFQAAMGALLAVFAAVNGSIAQQLGVEWLIFSTVASPVLKALTSS